MLTNFFERSAKDQIIGVNRTMPRKSAENHTRASESTRVSPLVNNPVAAIRDDKRLPTNPPMIKVEIPARLMNRILRWYMKIKATQQTSATFARARMNARRTGSPE